MHMAQCPHGNYRAEERVCAASAVVTRVVRESQLAWFRAIRASRAEVLEGLQVELNR